MKCPDPKYVNGEGAGPGIFSEPAKYLFIFDTPGKEGATKREFGAERLVLNFVSGSRYLGDYLGLQEELETQVKPQVEACSHGVRVLGKTDR